MADDVERALSEAGRKLTEQRGVWPAVRARLVAARRIAELAHLTPYATTRT